MNKTTTRSVGQPQRRSAKGTKETTIASSITTSTSGGGRRGRPTRSRRMVTDGSDETDDNPEERFTSELHLDIHVGLLLGIYQYSVYGRIFILIAMSHTSTQIQVSHLPSLNRISRALTVELPYLASIQFTIAISFDGEKQTLRPVY